MTLELYSAVFEKTARKDSIHNFVYNLCQLNLQLSSSALRESCTCLAAVWTFRVLSFGRLVFMFDISNILEHFDLQSSVVSASLVIRHSLQLRVETQTLPWQLACLQNNLWSILFHISNGLRYFPCLSKGQYWKWVFSDCCIFAYYHQGEISTLTSPSIFKNIFRDFVAVLANIIFD